MHVLESIDYWLDDFDDYAFKDFFKDLSAEMDVTNSIVLTKNDILNYLENINLKISDYFINLDSLNLIDKSLKHANVTYLDILLGQIRHIQVNIGYCNEKFSNNGVKSVEWIGYNE